MTSNKTQQTSSVTCLSELKYFKLIIWVQADRGCAVGDFFVGGEGAFGQKGL